MKPSLADSSTSNARFVHVICSLKLDTQFKIPKYLAKTLCCVFHL